MSTFAFRSDDGEGSCVAFRRSANVGFQDAVSACMPIVLRLGLLSLQFVCVSRPLQNQRDIQSTKA